jgi:hypothetical protein
MKKFKDSENREIFLKKLMLQVCECLEQVALCLQEMGAVLGKPTFFCFIYSIYFIGTEARELVCNIPSS